MQIEISFDQDSNRLNAVLDAIQAVCDVSPFVQGVYPIGTENGRVRVRVSADDTDDALPIKKAVESFLSFMVDNPTVEEI